MQVFEYDYQHFFEICAEFSSRTATVQNCTNILCFACNVPYANLEPKNCKSRKHPYN